MTTLEHLVFWELVEAGFRDIRVKRIDHTKHDGLYHVIFSTAPRFSFRTLDRMAAAFRSKDINFMGDRDHSITHHERATFVMKYAHV